jgi:hypothetical protein
MMQETTQSSMTRFWPMAVAGMAIMVGLGASLHRSASSSRLLSAAGEIRHLRLPLWDSTSGFGEPMGGKGPLAVFSPTILPLLLPVKWGWPLREVIRLTLAGLGAGLIARWWEARDTKLLIMAGMYILCGAILGQMRDTSEEVWTWLPWCVLATAWLIDRVTPARVTLVALAFSLVFASGDVASSAAVVLICLGFLAGRMRSFQAVLAAPVVVFALILALGMTGVVWLPWWEHRHTIEPATVKPPAKAWFVRNVKWYSSRDEVRKAIAEPGFDPKAVVLLEASGLQDWKAVVEWLKVYPNSPLRDEVPVSVNDTTPGHWRITLPSERGYLVIAQTWNSNWAASISPIARLGQGSRDLVVLPADGGLIAIPTHGGGTGAVRLDYRPLPFRRGAIVSAASGVMCLLLLGISAAGRRRVTNELPAAGAAYIVESAPAL